MYSYKFSATSYYAICTQSQRLTTFWLSVCVVLLTLMLKTLEGCTKLCFFNFTNKNVQLGSSMTKTSRVQLLNISGRNPNCSCFHPVPCVSYCWFQVSLNILLNSCSLTRKCRCSSLRTLNLLLRHKHKTRSIGLLMKEREGLHVLPVCCYQHRAENQPPENWRKLLIRSAAVKPQRLLSLLKVGRTDRLQTISSCKAEPPLRV